MDLQIHCAAGGKQGNITDTFLLPREGGGGVVKSVIFVSRFPELELVNQEAKGNINTDVSINNNNIICSL